MSHGQKADPLPVGQSCHETTLLTGAFNQMAETLAEREDKLKALNRRYMDTLGFVAHELKSPVATIMNHAYLLREQKQHRQGYRVPMPALEANRRAIGMSAGQRWYSARASGITHFTARWSASRRRPPRIVAW